MALEAGQGKKQGRGSTAAEPSFNAGPMCLSVTPARPLSLGVAARVIGACGRRCSSWAFGFALFAAVACTPLYSNHGFIPEEADLAQIKTGVDTRDTVAAFLGRPSTEGVLGDNEWFYVQSRWKTIGGRAPMEINREVVAISFDDKGHVANIERFGLEEGQVVAITRRITTEPIHGRSALMQIFSNVGKMDPAAMLNSK